MSVLICGSIAYDTIMVFDGRFGDHILPDRVHSLSVGFVVPALRRNYGGCGGNIAYNARLLGLEVRLLGAAGDDFTEYGNWLRRHGVNLDHVRVFPGTYTAQAYITTDVDANQITAFHPGAMAHAHEIAIPADGSVKLAIVAPDAADAVLAAMQQHPLGAQAVRIGVVTEDPHHFVQMATRFGGRRVVDWLSGEPLPRIC